MSCRVFTQIAFAMFGVYVTLDERNVLDAQKVFVSMALINILKTPLSQLPFAISTTMQVGEVFAAPARWIRVRELTAVSAPGCGFAQTSGEVSLLRGAEGGQRLQGSAEFW